MSNRKVKSTGRSAAKKPAPKKTTAKQASKAKSAKSAGTKKAAKAKTPKKSAPKKAMPKPFVPFLSAGEKREIVERYIAAYNRRDTAAILALYDPKAKMEDPIGLPPAVGHAAIAGLYQMGFDMGVTISLDGAVRLAGNEAAFPLLASTPTSKLHVIDVFEFGRRGRIVRMRAYWGPDNLEGDLAVRQ